MIDDSINAEFWIMANVRRCNTDGMPAMVIHRGDNRGGTLLLKINRFELGCKLLTQARDIDGVKKWLVAFSGKLVEEVEADAYIKRAVSRDPDLWVVEIETPDGTHPFEGDEF
jgi:hypothetical protein